MADNAPRAAPLTDSEIRQLQGRVSEA